VIITSKLLYFLLLTVSELWNITAVQMNTDILVSILYITMSGAVTVYDSSVYDTHRRDSHRCFPCRLTRQGISYVKFLLIIIYTIKFSYYSIEY